MPARRRAAWRCSPPARSRSPSASGPPARSRLKNTGAAATTDPALHPQDSTSFLTSDVYRLSASATGTGWTAKLRNALTAVKFGESASIPVYVTKAANAASAGTVTLTATSESDPSATQTAVCALGNGDVGGSVPATLALTLGTPAAFGAFTPGIGKDYAASTTANVISTAGDATLSVADPSATATGRLVNGAFSLNQALQAQASSPAAGLAKPFAAVGGSATPDHAGELDPPGVQRPGGDRLQADDPGQRTAAHGRLLEDAHVHPVDYVSVVGLIPSAGRVRAAGASAFKRHFGGPAFPSRGRDPMAESVYRVTEVIGVSSDSWEAAAKAAVDTAAKTVRDLRVAEVVRQDVTIGDGGVVNFRVRLAISFKYDSGD